MSDTMSIREKKLETALIDIREQIAFMFADEIDDKETMAGDLARTIDQALATRPGLIVRQRMWAIRGKDFFYYGTFSRRVDAIAQHVEEVNGIPNRSRGYLTPEQRVAWEKCRRQGARAVLIDVSEVAR